MEIARYGVMLLGMQNPARYYEILAWCEKNLRYNEWVFNRNNDGEVTSISMYSNEAKMLFELTWK